MKVTDYMLNRWTRASFEIILGILLLIYLESLIGELTNFFQESALSTGFLVSLLRALLYLFTIWLFVSAALNIVSAFRAPKMSFSDVVKKIDAIDAKISNTLGTGAGVNRAPEPRPEAAPKSFEQKVDKDLPPPPPGNL